MGLFVNDGPFGARYVRGRQAFAIADLAEATASSGDRPRMPRRIYLFSLLLVLVGLWGCLLEPDSHESSQSFSLVSSSLYLIRGDSAKIEADLDAEEAEVPGLSYSWSANFGSVVGGGPTITYVAADTAGSAVIRVSVQRLGTPYGHGSLRIPVYRQIILLKADDFVYSPYTSSGFTPGWQMYLDYLEEQGLKSAVGVIGARVKDGTDGFFEQAGLLHERGTVEYFNHGYGHELNVTDEQGHTYCEFRGTPVEYQQTRLQATQALWFEKTGIVLRGFAAPGNAFDGATRQAIASADDIVYWLFGWPIVGKILLEYHPCKMEEECAQPRYEVFTRTYVPEQRMIVYQLHPWFWTRTEMAEFIRCVNALRAAGATFMLPLEYCRLLGWTERNLPPALAEVGPRIRRHPARQELGHEGGNQGTLTIR